MGRLSSLSEMVLLAPFTSIPSTAHCLPPITQQFGCCLWDSAGNVSSTRAQTAFLLSAVQSTIRESVESAVHAP